MDALRFLCNLDDGARRNLVMELHGPFRLLSAEEAHSWRSRFAEEAPRRMAGLSAPLQSQVVPDKAQVADQQKGQNTMLRRTKLLAELRAVCASDEEYEAEKAFLMAPSDVRRAHLLAKLEAVDAVDADKEERDAQRGARVAALMASVGIKMPADLPADASDEERDRRDEERKARRAWRPSWPRSGLLPTNERSCDCV